MKGFIAPISSVSPIQGSSNQPLKEILLITLEVRRKQRLLIQILYVHVSVIISTLCVNSLTTVDNGLNGTSSRWATLFSVCWSFAEKTFVKQSMMLCVWNFAQIWRFGGGVNHHCRFGVNRHCRFDAKSSVRFTPPPPPKSSSLIWSHGPLHLTSSVKGILGKISISESAFEERGRFFKFHYITFDYLLFTTI